MGTGRLGTAVGHRGDRCSLKQLLLRNIAASEPLGVDGPCLPPDHRPAAT